MRSEVTLLCGSRIQEFHHDDNVRHTAGRGPSLKGAICGLLHRLRCYAVIPLFQFHAYQPPQSGRDPRPFCRPPVALRTVYHRPNRNYDAILKRPAVVREDADQVLAVVSDRYALVPHQRLLEQALLRAERRRRDSVLALELIQCPFSRPALGEVLRDTWWRSRREAERLRERPRSS